MTCVAQYERVQLHGYSDGYVLFIKDGRRLKNRIAHPSVIEKLSALMEGKEGPFDVHLEFESAFDGLGTLVTDAKEIKEIVIADEPKMEQLKP